MLMLPAQILLENTDFQSDMGVTAHFPFQHIAAGSHKTWATVVGNLFRGLCDWGHWCETYLQMSTFLVGGCTYTSKFWHFSSQVHLGRGRSGTVLHQEKFEWMALLTGFILHFYLWWTEVTHTVAFCGRILHIMKTPSKQEAAWFVKNMFRIKCPLPLMCCQSSHLRERD